MKNNKQSRKQTQVNGLRISLNEDSLEVEMSSKGLSMPELRTELFKTFKKLGVKKDEFKTKDRPLSMFG